jgi:hypothetical protein
MEAAVVDSAKWRRKETEFLPQLRFVAVFVDIIGVGLLLLILFSVGGREAADLFTFKMARGYDNRVRRQAGMGPWARLTPLTPFGVAAVCRAPIADQGRPAATPTFLAPRIICMSATAPAARRLGLPPATSVAQRLRTAWRPFATVLGGALAAGPTRVRPPPFLWVAAASLSAGRRPWNLGTTRRLPSTFLRYGPSRIGAAVVLRACGRNCRLLRLTRVLAPPAREQGAEAACGRTNWRETSASDIELIFIRLHRWGHRASARREARQHAIPFKGYMEQFVIGTWRGETPGADPTR